MKVIIFILALFTVSPAFAEILASANDVRMVPPPAMPMPDRQKSDKAVQQCLTKKEVLVLVRDELKKRKLVNEEGLEKKLKETGESIGENYATKEELQFQQIRQNNYSTAQHAKAVAAKVDLDKKLLEVDKKSSEAKNKAEDALQRGVWIIVAIIVICVLFALWGYRAENRYVKIIPK